MEEIKNLFKSYRYADNDIKSFFSVDQLEKLEYHTSMLSFEKAFDIAYEKKYDNHMFNARNVMYNLLSCRHDLSAIFGSSHSLPLTPSQITQKPNRKGEVILRAGVNESYELSKTLKNHFDMFLNSINESEINLHLSHSGTEDYRVFYVNYVDILVFSLYYIFQDGRFSSDAPSEQKKFPRFKTENSCSISSYKTAFKSILNLYDKIMGQYLSNEDFVFYMIQLHRINEEFKFFNLNNILVAKNCILSDEVLEYVYNHFELTYNETLCLKETLEKEIFEDSDFISYCLESSFSNPLFVFKSLFESILDRYFLMYSYRKSCSYEELPWNTQFYDSNKITKELSLADLIAFSKKKTMQYINKLTDEIHNEVTSHRKDPEINNINRFDVGFWVENYFGGKNLLSNYIEVNSEGKFEKDDYLDFLANIVVKNLPKSFYK